MAGQLGAAGRQHAATAGARWRRPGRRAHQVDVLADGDANGPCRQRPQVHKPVSRQVRRLHEELPHTDPQTSPLRARSSPNTSPSPSGPAFSCVLFAWHTTVAPRRPVRLGAARRACTTHGCTADASDMFLNCGNEGVLMRARQCLPSASWVADSLGCGDTWRIPGSRECQGNPTHSRGVAASWGVPCCSSQPAKIKVGCLLQAGSQGPSGWASW